MTKSLSYSLSALALFIAAPASAEVTAAELWAEWQDQSTSMGQVLAAEEVIETENGLTLRGFTSTFSDPEVTTVGRAEEITMTENGDGTVDIAMSELYTMNISFVEAPSAPPVNIGLELRSQDLTITASGDPGARVYDYAASQITLTEGEISGGRGAPPVIDMEITMNDLAANYQLDLTDPTDISYSSTSSFSGAQGFADITPPPEEEGHLKFSFSLGATEAGGAGSLGNFPEMADNPDLVPSDFDLSADFTYDRLSYEVTFEHPDDAFAMFYANQGGSIAVTFSDTEMDYRLAATGAEGRVTVPDMPFPIEASVGSAEVAFRFPMAASADPQDVAARLAYQDVEISDQVWNMFDPGQGIPRDPISVIADLSGSALVTTNLLTLDENTNAPPGEMRALTLNELRISAGGAELTGTGDVTFAPGQIVPMPVGSVDLQLAGSNALLDRLQQSGLVPVEQSAMVRGMLGAFARPGATPDTLESTVEFTEGGGITANGVPLQ